MAVVPSTPSSLLLLRLVPSLSFTSLLANTSRFSSAFGPSSPSNAASSRSSSGDARLSPAVVPRPDLVSPRRYPASAPCPCLPRTVRPQACSRRPHPGPQPGRKFLGLGHNDGHGHLDNVQHASRGHNNDACHDLVHVHARQCFLFLRIPSASLPVCAFARVKRCCDKGLWGWMGPLGHSGERARCGAGPVSSPCPSGGWARPPVTLNTVLLPFSRSSALMLTSRCPSVTYRHECPARASCRMRSLAPSRRRAPPLRPVRPPAP